jgi:hypothetical protein
MRWRGAGRPSGARSKGGCRPGHRATECRDTPSAELSDRDSVANRGRVGRGDWRAIGRRGATQRRVLGRGHGPGAGRSPEQNAPFLRLPEAPGSALEQMSLKKADRANIRRSVPAQLQGLAFREHETPGATARVGRVRRKNMERKKRGTLRPSLPIDEQRTARHHRTMGVVKSGPRPTCFGCL